VASAYLQLTRERLEELIAEDELREVIRDD
jgi:hypothetical protein